MRNKKNKSKKYKKAILNLVIYIMLLSILLYSGIKIYKWYKDKTNNNKIAEQIRDTVIVEEKNEDENKEESKVDFNKLKEQNSDAVAWIKVNNTNIYISSGIASPDIGFRLFNPPSINFFRLTNKK